MTHSVGCAVITSFSRPHTTGKERDAESGNDYFGARHYASTMGRMLSPDPLSGSLANPQSLNKYAYVLNNPLVNTDPTGLYVCADSKDCSSENDANFAKSLNQARAALNANTSLSGEDLLNATNALNSYGKQNINNGVSVGFDSNIQGGATQVSGVANGPNDKANNNPSHQDIRVKFNPESAKDPSLVAHEGSHVADGEAWVKSGFSPGKTPTRYQTEVNAYHVQFNLMQEMPRYGFGKLDVRIGTAEFIPGESFKDFLPGLQTFLKNDPRYRLTSDDKTSVFVKGAVPRMSAGAKIGHRAPLERSSAAE